MELEHITAPPPEDSPQQRYAKLQRAIKKGLASDRAWTELAEVCLELGLHDEALTAQAKIRRSSERVHLQNKMVRQGLMQRPEFRARSLAQTEHDGIFAEIGEAARFLTDDQMPVVVILTSVAFPLLMGLGGYVSDLRPDLLPVSAVAVPAVLVLMTLLAVCRRVVVEAAQGIDDAPRLPGPFQLFKESLKLVSENAMAAILLIGPAVSAWLYGMPWYGVLGGLLCGVLLLPMAVGLLMVEGGLRGLMPQVLVPAVCRAGGRYLGVLLAIPLLLAPATLCWALASDTLPLLRIAYVGPLVAAPLLMCFRLLGRCLRDVVDSAAAAAQAPRTQPEPRPAPRRPAGLSTSALTATTRPVTRPAMRGAPRPVPRARRGGIDSGGGHHRLSSLGAG